MLPTAQGSIRLIRVFGIDVFVHWSWFVIALITFGTPGGRQLFVDWLWHVATYLSLFAIVLVHEFGHALACRSVGGIANRIVLWPLGGVAYVQPPQRPGAVLWSIAAGPLVNVVLVPITLALFLGVGQLQGSFFQSDDLHRFLFVLVVMNASLLAFNILPVYPLDGGQIVQALLWFVVGRTRSLLISSVIGIVVAVVGGVVAFAIVRDMWLVIMALFIGWQSFNGYVMARQLAEQERMQREFGPM